jgi:CHAD domain-containing protein
LAFHFKRSESIPAGAGRILVSELDLALDSLSSPEQTLDHRVHEARKCLKRVRALLALARGSADAGLVERLRRHVRRAAHALSELRGRAALAEIFLALTKRYPGELPAPLGDELERALNSGASWSSERTAQALAAASDTLTQARSDARAFHVRGDGFAALEPGFRRTYARARRDLRLARKTGEVEHLHDFRTHAKRHLYQLATFEKVWPKLVRVESKELDRLGEHLGEHHDLSLLLPALEATTDAPLDELERLVERRKRDLERKIFARAARLFSEKPKLRSRRFAGYHAALGFRPRKDAS